MDLKVLLESGEEKDRITAAIAISLDIPFDEAKMIEEKQCDQLLYPDNIQVEYEKEFIC